MGSTFTIAETFFTTLTDIYKYNDTLLKNT